MLARGSAASMVRDLPFASPGMVPVGTATAVITGPVHMDTIAAAMYTVRCAVFIADGVEPLELSWLKETAGSERLPAVLH